MATTDEIVRSFARAWGEIGAAWGVAPSTATVQGYLLAHGGALSEPEVRRALGLSHRAASLALQQCEEWGLIRRTQEARRTGQRGPAATTWVVVGDHWEWFRRVAEVRRERETGPVLPLIERCAADAAAAAAGDPAAEALRQRMADLLEFVRRFDRGVEVFVRGRPETIAGLFATIEAMSDEDVARLWRLVDELTPSELASALTALSRLPTSAVRRLIGLAESATLRRLLGLR